MNISALEAVKSKGVRAVATKAIGRSSLVIRHHSPVILTSAGVVGIVTAGVMASKSTLKLESVVNKTNEGLQNIAFNTEHDPGYDDKQANKDRTLVYTHTVLDMVKLYGPAVSLGAVSIACIVGAQGIMHKRNVAMVAAYKAVEQSYSEYRRRVIEEFGEKKDQDYRYGLTEEKTKDKDTGKVTKVTHVNPNGISQYARFFDETSFSWSKTPEYNLLFLKCQQNWANDLLQARGHIFLNEVYDMLGLERSQAGAVVGWVLSKDGDNFVDFNIYDFESQKAREFVNGHERSILLDFNVDGLVYDRI